MNDSISQVQSRKNMQPWLSLSFILLLAGGWLYYPLGYFLLACMAGAMGIGMVKGRYWCDWLCPRGSFFDTLLSKISRAGKVPALFRHPAFRLGWLAVLMTMLTMQLIPVWGDFYLMGKPFVMVLTITTIVGTFFGITYHQRIWCMFCPMGTMANWLGRGKMPLTINDACSQCGTCEKVCRMQINPGSYQEVGQVKHGDCLKCSYCVDSCPQQALSFSDK
ncbi:MAG: 4Fe-4S binding protein [Desulfobulbaceae bacterium]|nr:MAG: 4Fe-4S binding protein [Desulfobulbaceae bacterium]